MFKLRWWILWMSSIAAIRAHHASSTNISASLWWNHFYCIHPSINFMTVKRDRAAPLSLRSVYPKMRHEHSRCYSQRGSLSLFTQRLNMYFSFKKWYALTSKVSQSLAGLFQGLQQILSTFFSSPLYHDTLKRHSHSLHNNISPLFLQAKRTGTSSF